MIYIQRFMDKVRAVQAQRKGNAPAMITLTIDEAQNLKDDITVLTMRIEQLREAIEDRDNMTELPSEIVISGKDF